MMRLHFNGLSPYARKVRVVAHETGLDDQIETEVRTMTPVQPDADLNRDNPLGKIPCLVLSDGSALYDSRVICEYLDDLHHGAKLFPPSGPQRWRALRRQALGDGMMDAALDARYEMVLRPRELQWPAWVDQQISKAQRALDVLEVEADQLHGVVDIGTITLGCALGYVDFRFPDERWRQHRPRLAAWFEEFDARTSMRASAPAAG